MKQPTVATRIQGLMAPLIAAHDNSVVGNLIGTNASGTGRIANVFAGIRLTGDNNVIGGLAAGSGNVIALNNDDGITASSGTGNSILGNSIYQNGTTAQQLGIDLGPSGVTPNDVSDGDTGANNLQNFPVLTSAVDSGVNTTIQGSLNSLSNTTFRVEFLDNSVCDASGFGEGKNFVGSANVTTDGSGSAAIITTFTGLLNRGFITSTATRLDDGGNPTDTSEFSAYLSTNGGTGGDILFTTNRDGNTEIYKMNSDGTNQQRLTNTPENESGGYWSPNGQKILYSKTTSSGIQIWVMNADGSGQTMVSNPTDLNFPSQWSPDGQRILFTVGQPLATARIWTMNADGSNKLPITTPPSFDSVPRWSPDGTRIVFSRCGLSLICDVFTINADGSNPTNLTPGNPDADGSPAWSPDSSKIVYGSKTESTAFNTFIMNADGSNKQVLTNALDPSFYEPWGRSPISPNGSFVTLRFSNGIGETEIFSVGINGSGLTNITNNAARDVFGAWSPDSSKIAFMSRRDTPTDEIYAMNADGTGVVRLTNNAATDTVTDWFSTPVGFCSSSTLAVGQSFSGAINGATCVVGADKTDPYTFSGTTGQQIAVTMTTSQFFSKIELLDPNGTVVATAGGVNGVNNSRLPSNGYFTLPSSGTYTIRTIAAFGGSGNYTLSLYQAPVANCTYSLSPVSTNVPSQGGTFYFDVITQPGCPPAAAPAASGVIYSNLLYSGGRVTFTVGPNPLAGDVLDTITVAGQTHAIRQFGIQVPGNDNFATPQILTGINSPPNAPITGNNVSATAEASEPAKAGSPAMKSVWYAWTAPAGASGLYSFSTSGSSFDTVMAIYACPATGVCSFANISLVGSNDDATAFDKTSKVNFRAAAGTGYMIGIDGKNGASGTIALSWRQYERLYRLYLQNFNGNPATIVPDTVKANNGVNTVDSTKVSLGVYEFNLPADGTTYSVAITGPAGIVWDPNNFPLTTGFGKLDELMAGPEDGGQNSVSNAQNQTPRYIFGYIRNITAQEISSLTVKIGSSRGPNPRSPVPCLPLSSTVVNGTPYALYQCLTEPQTLHDIVPTMPGKSFTASVKSFDQPIDNDVFSLPSSGFIAANSPTYNISGHVSAGGQGTTVDLAYTPAGNSLEISLRATTDAAGAYSFPGLSPNTYRIKASKTGFVFNQPPNISLQTADQTVDITAQTPCTYTPASLTASPMTGGPGQFQINTSDPTCEWTAVSDVPWIAINSGATVATGPVHFMVAANTAAAYRTGSIRISGRPTAITFVQLGSDATFGTITGRVTTPDGRGLRNATVILTDPLGNRQSAVTNSFGLYNLFNLPVGNSYTLSIASKRFRFSAIPLQIANITATVDFVGIE